MQSPGLAATSWTVYVVSPTNRTADFLLTSFFGPQVRSAEDFHKEQAMLARQALKNKQQETSKLRLALNAAESEARIRQQAVAELQNKCEQLAHHLQRNQAHETAIEDQLMQDQSEIAAWASTSDPSVRPEVNTTCSTVPIPKCRSSFMIARSC